MSHTFFTAGDLRRILEPLTLVKRKLVLYALDSGKDLGYACALQWRMVTRKPIDGYAQWILMSMPRHIVCPYVFWEYDETGTPKTFTEESIEDALEMVSPLITMDRLRAGYQAIIWFDAREDADDFARILNQMTGKASGNPSGK